MTIEEAIKIIKAAMETMYLPKSKSYISDFGYALEMAIKALEQQPPDDAELKDIFCMGCEYKEQKPCDDWYDVPSDEMTLEQARQAVKDLRKKLAECLEQESCDVSDTDVGKIDVVSRQAVLDGLASIAKVKARSDAQKSLMGRIMFFVEQLPPVTPKEKTGCWVGIDEEPHEDWECDNCGFVIWADENIEKFHYCPNCGRHMVELQESEEVCI